MSGNTLLIGIAAGVIGLAMTFLMPVSARRVNQALVGLIVVAVFGAAAVLLFPAPDSLVIAAVASIAALLYRDVVRFVRHVYWDLTKYTRRDYWYRRVGEAVLNGRRTTRRRRR